MTRRNQWTFIDLLVILLFFFCFAIGLVFSLVTADRWQPKSNARTKNKWIEGQLKEDYARFNVSQLMTICMIMRYRLFRYGFKSLKKKTGNKCHFHTSSGQ